MGFYFLNTLCILKIMSFFFTKEIVTYPKIMPSSTWHATTRFYCHFTAYWQGAVNVHATSSNQQTGRGRQDDGGGG
jgi:hypothetical protein